MRFAFIEVWKEDWSVELLCRVMQVSPRGFRAWRVRPMSQRQRDDMVILAHIREQHRPSLQSYGRPRMTEELQELGVNVGHRRIGRPLSADLALPNRLPGNGCARTAYLLCEHANTRSPQTVTTSSISRQTCWTETSMLMHQTKSGLATSVISGRARDGCIWQ